MSRPNDPEIEETAETVTEPEVTEEVTEEATEETTETEEVEPVKSPEVSKVVDQLVTELRDKLAQPGARPQPSQEEMVQKIRTQIKEQTGMNDQQIDYMEGRINAAVAPLVSQNVFSDWARTKGDVITEDIKTEMQEELKQYPANLQANRDLLEKVLRMVIGGRTLSGKLPAKTVTKVAADGQPIAGRKIVSNNPGSTRSLNGNPSGSTVQLTAEEKTIAKKMRIPESRYLAAKKTRVISELKK